MIRTLMRVMGRGRAGPIVVMDDVASTRAKGRLLVVKVDMLVEGTDVPPGMTYRQAARKAVAACVSDFAAKGVRPVSFLISLGLRKGTTRAQVEQLGRGFRDAEEEWGVRLVGGDTNESRELVIDCAMTGFAEKVVGRRGAHTGEAVVATGLFGYEPAGLRILTGGAKAEGTFGTRATDRVLNPRPNLQAGLALAGYFTSSMDSSDGLARTLHTLAKASGVGFDVTAVPKARGLEKFARENGLSAEELTLEGGEEYLIVGTMSPMKVQAAAKAAKRAGSGLVVIGTVTSHSGRVVQTRRGSTLPIHNRGWTHLG